MRSIAIAVAAVFTAAAPAAFADRYDETAPRANDSRYDSRYDNQSRYDNTGRSDKNNRSDDRDYRYDNRDNRDNRYDSRDNPYDSRDNRASNAREECWNARAGHYEELRDRKHSRIGKDTAIGAVAGGVVGNQVDHGTGTAVGAVLGGLVGHQVEKRGDSDDQPDLDRSRCRVIADDGGPYRREGYSNR